MSRLFDRAPAQRTAVATAAAPGFIDLPLTPVIERLAPAAAPAPVHVQESLVTAAGTLIDTDEHLFQRISGGKALHRRDLTPMQQDRMLQIVWYLFESNPLARRLITLGTDLVVGEGITIEAKDDRIADELEQVWTPRRNPIRRRIRQFHDAFSLDGELAVSVARNPITGRPRYGYIGAAQIRDVIPEDGDILTPDILLLKADRPGGKDRPLKIVRENPETGVLEGEVFYFCANNLPNSTRGRSLLLPLADWLDLYDQYLFAEVERVTLLNNFVWDLTIKGATPQQVKERLAEFPTPKPGSIFAHNENEELESRSPTLNAHERSEVARVLRVHIAGSMGYPTSYLGDIDSNRATIEGQNDVMLKTPAARQREFAGVIDMLVRYSIEGAMAANPALFKGVDPAYRIGMPEIHGKDIARVGTVISGVVSAMDTAMANRTMSRKAAISVTAALISQLGIELDPKEIEEQADEDETERQANADARQAILMANAVRGQKRNPAIPQDGAEEPAA
ncbi:MAG: hypothetical protein AB7P99_06345 [Vicinamibacterales bacterium]